MAEQLKEYRAEISRLTDPYVREESLGELSNAMSKVSEYINDSEDQRKVQIKMMGSLIKMLDSGTRRAPKKEI